MAEEARLSQQQLSAYLDGELSSAEAAEVERRLQTDTLARRELAELTAVSRLLARSVTPVPPRDYRSVVPRTRPWRRLFEWAPALVATAAVALIALGAMGAVSDQAREAPHPLAQPAPARISLVEVSAKAEAPGRERATATDAEAPAAATVPVTVEREAAAEVVPEAAAESAVTVERDIAVEADTQASDATRSVASDAPPATRGPAQSTAAPRAPASQAPPANAGGREIAKAQTIERAPPPSVPVDEVRTAAQATREAVVPAPSVAGTPDPAGAPFDARTPAPPTAIRAAGAGVSLWPFALGAGLRCCSVQSCGRCGGAGGRLHRRPDRLPARRRQRAGTVARESCGPTSRARAGMPDRTGINRA